MAYRKELLWILLPFVIGLGGIYLIPAPYLSQVIIVFFWFWVGKKFGGLNVSKLRSFALGNSIWGICLVIFVWQFLLESEPQRIKALEAVSLSYISPFYILTHALPPIGYFSGFTLTSSMIVLTLVGYFVMFAIFTLGFIWARVVRRWSDDTSVI